MAITWITLLDIVYPVGSIYITESTDSPASSFGGTWAQVTGGLLGCAGSTGLAANGSTGGSATISTSQMPSHNHKVTNGTWIVYFGNATASFAAQPMSTTTGEYTARASSDVTDSSLTGVKTGGGQPYYPAHISFNVYRRTA